ncbi:ABC transporter ATP-binding protein [Nocardia sp. NPDC050175]|uniref:ABC transporter ATP-binding protein n=1 Tax=Nocardia sp. NPDC050175 TaxID=3364317 RepID=UPI0037B5CD84
MSAVGSAVPSAVIVDAPAGRDSQTLRNGLAIMVRGCRDHLVAALIALGSSAINGTCMVLGAKAVGWSTEHVVVAGFAQGRFLVGAAAAAALFVLGVSLMRITTIIVRGVATGVIQFRGQATMRKSIVAQYLRLAIPWHRRRAAGQLVSHAISDVDTAWAPMQHFPFAVGMTVMLLLVMIDIVTIDLWLAIVAAVLIPLVLGTNLAYQRVLAPRARAAQRERAAVSAMAHEAIAGGQVIRTLGIVDHEVQRFADAARAARLANRRMGRVGAVFDPTIELMPPFAALVILAIGAVRIGSGQLGVGPLVEVIYLLITTAMPLNVLGRFLGGVPLAVAGYTRVRDILAVDQTPGQGLSRLATGESAVPVEVRSASFGYGTAAAVRDIGLRAEPGEIVAVVGRTGAGKSTVLALLADLLQSDQGSVRLDGVDVRQVLAGEVPRRAALVTQTAFLFEDTVRDNVTLGAAASDAAVWRALRVAGAAEFVEQLPGGLDTELSEQSQLSGGQRQRIALARAVFRRPGLLLLDDATSALDPVVERAVVDGLRTEYAADDRRTTVVLVGHRAATITLADTVLLLDRGRVVATGTHEELLAAVPDYRGLLAAYGSEGTE